MMNESFNSIRDTRQHAQVRHDLYTSCAYWYQTLPSAPLKPLPSDKEMIMK